MTDEEIVENFYTWIPSYTCERAAEGYFSFLSSVVDYKPQLIEPLLKKAIEPVYYLGFENAESILHWVEYFVNKPDTHDYRPSNSGKLWLREELPI